MILKSRILPNIFRLLAVLLLLLFLSSLDVAVSDDDDTDAPRPSKTIESSSGRVGALTKPNISLASVNVTGVFETYSEASAIVETRMVMNSTPNDDDEEETGFVDVFVVVAVVVVVVLLNTTLQSGPAKNVDSGMIDESQPTVYPSKPFVDWKYNGKNCGNIALWKEYNQYNKLEYTTIGGCGCGCGVMDSSSFRGVLDRQ
mmetsp:Transcript_61160/g.149729  ORF Transcript_61160/g.149729 Transcript_61160/m.149729 type:complete len:201 (+) Transcript_61160:932-1534(+)